MAAAVQVDVDDDNTTVADCVPTPTATEVFGCTNDDDDDVTTEVVVVAFEVVIVNVGTVTLDMLNCRVGKRTTETYSDGFGHCECASPNLYKLLVYRSNIAKLCRIHLSKIKKKQNKN